MRLGDCSDWLRRPGRGGGVTAAAWGSLCDTITTTLCWCRGSLFLLRIPPELPLLARSGHSRRPSLWLRPSHPRDVTLQPSHRSRPSGSTASAAAAAPAAFTSTALGFFAAASRGRGGGRDKVGVRVRCGDWRRPCGFRPGEGGVGVGVVNSLRFHEILRSVARYRRRRRRRGFR